MQVQPGLGLSETWYSWLVSILSIGEFAGAVVTSLLLRKIYIKYLLLAYLALCAFGGLLYGVGQNGWMLFTGVYQPSYVYYM